MPYRKFEPLKLNFELNIRRNSKMASYAHRWEAARFRRGTPNFSGFHMSSMVEYSYLRVFVFWEEFLEESFMLYLLGVSPPKGRAPSLLIKPYSRKIADQIIREGKDFVDWAGIDNVISRAERYFRKGRPYINVRANRNVFNDMKQIRNTIAHSSGAARKKFERLVRQELGFLPAELSPGLFLDTIIPANSYMYNRIPAGLHPISYLDGYFFFIETAANQIVRT